MSNWYYLIAQLPAISLDMPVNLPITEEYFTDLCSRFLSGSILNTLKSLSLEPPRTSRKTGSSVVDAWYNYERQLRFALGTIRAQRMKKDFPVEDPYFSADILQTARTACGFDNPLEAELYLNAARAQFLSRATPSNSFSTDAVFAYGLTLKLMLRIRKFNEELGLESYRKIYEQILENSNNAYIA